MMKKLWIIFFSMIATPALWAGPQYNLTRGVTPISQDIYHLHMFAFWVCVGIGVVVFGAMLYVIIYHRKSKGAKAARFHSNLKLEILWAVIPAILLIALAIPATYVLMKMNNTDDAALNIKVTGYQWKWHYDYLNEGISFYSNMSTPMDEIHNKMKKNQHYLLQVDHPLVLPVKTKVRLLMTSNDVIHSWWVPALGVKRDAVPGFINESWVYIDKPGVYRGQCAELCGMNHAFMPIVVIAKTQKDFQQWVKSQQAELIAKQQTSTKQFSKEELMQLGEKVYLKTCSACHQPNGKGIPPTFPSLVGSPLIKGDVANHIDIVLNGKSGTAMQAFREQLSDAEIAAVITYERNAFGNNTGDVVQPQVIKKAKGGETETVAPTKVKTQKPKITASAESLEKGKAIFQQYCTGCHQPATWSQITDTDKNEQIKQTLYGNDTETMPHFDIWLDDKEIADVLNYINAQAGNVFTAKEVKHIRAQYKEQYNDEDQ